MTALRSGIILLLLLAVGMLSGCGNEHMKMQSWDSSSASSGQVAFENGFYAFTKAQNCVKCHGNGTGPQFAASDVGSAYGVAKSFLNVNSPDNSTFVIYAGNGHCLDTPCSDPSIRPKVAALMETWAKAEGGAVVTGPKYLTETLALPTTIPTLAGAPVVLRFKLDSFDVDALGNAILEVELQLINPTEYRVNRIKIGGNTSAVTVSGIHVFVRPASGAGMGTEDANQGSLWNSLTATAPVFALPQTLPVGPIAATPLSTVPLSIQAQSTADMMTIGIDGIQ